MHPRDLQAAPGLPAGVALRWLGTAGYELRAGDATLLIDPYLTRVGLFTFLTRRLVADAALLARELPRADVILVGHSHFDHALDVPAIAAHTGAPVYGSRSTANLLRRSGAPAAQVHALPADRRTTFEVGPFRITAVPSEHSRFAIGKNVPYPGDIVTDDDAPETCDIELRGREYRCGDVFNYLIEVDGFRLYHMGSANLAEDAIPAEARQADLLLLCIAARFATRNFVERALRAVEPRRVVPMHYDNFFRAWGRPMKLLPRTGFGRFVDEVGQVSRDFGVLTLPLG